MCTEGHGLRRSGSAVWHGPAARWIGHVRSSGTRVRIGFRRLLRESTRVLPMPARPWFVRFRRYRRAAQGAFMSVELAKAEL